MVSSTRRTAGCGPACPVVWQGRVGDHSPYADSKKVSKKRHQDDACTSARTYGNTQRPAALLRSSRNRRAALVITWFFRLQPGLDSFSRAMGNEISAHPAGPARSWPLRHSIETV